MLTIPNEDLAIPLGNTGAINYPRYYMGYLAQAFRELTLYCFSADSSDCRAKQQTAIAGIYLSTCR
jgi:hypothetical protein